MTDRLLTADQLAERWQVPKSQVYALTRRGEIPTVKLGKYYRYRLDAIEAGDSPSLARVPALRTRSPGVYHAAAMDPHPAEPKPLARRLVSHFLHRAKADALGRTSHAMGTAPPAVTLRILWLTASAT